MKIRCILHKHVCVMLFLLFQTKMKLLLICLFAVHIASVVCTYRRNGASSRNSVSFLLRKVCVEVTGLKEEVTGLKREITGLNEDIAGLKEENSALNDRVSATEEAGKVINPYGTNRLSHPYDLDESTFILRGAGSNISF